MERVETRTRTYCKHCATSVFVVEYSLAKLVQDSPGERCGPFIKINLFLGSLIGTGIHWRNGFVPLAFCICGPGRFTGKYLHKVMDPGTSLLDLLQGRGYFKVVKLRSKRMSITMYRGISRNSTLSMLSTHLDRRSRRSALADTITSTTAAISASAVCATATTASTTSVGVALIAVIPRTRSIAVSHRRISVAASVLIRHYWICARFALW